MIRQLHSRFLAWNEGRAVAAPGRLSSERKASTACRMLTNPLKILIEQTIANGTKLILALLSDTSVSISHFFSSGLKRSIRIQSNGSLSLLNTGLLPRAYNLPSTPRISTQYPSPSLMPVINCHSFVVSSYISQAGGVGRAVSPTT